MSNLSIDIMSKLTVFSKYSKFVPELSRRENFIELATRNRDMHIKKYPFLRERIIEIYDKFVFTMKVLPSMRSMQFGGKPIFLNEARIYNCSYLPVDHYKAFSETMFLLLGGTGVGYSVQQSHVNKLPSIRKPVKSKKFVISDDIIGWAESVRVLVEAYLNGGFDPKFVFDDIRDKGEPLGTSGGKAPGPDPLRNCLRKIRDIFETKNNGQKLTSLECHDIQCFIADAVLSGGIRRAAMIALFSIDDTEMIWCKSNFRLNLLEEAQMGPGSWQVRVETAWNNKEHRLIIDQKHYEMLKSTGRLPWWWFEPQRALSNNSAVFVRHRSTREEFIEFCKMIEQTGSGDPGIYFTNNPEWGTNPCAEIALRPFQFCNLCEINMGTVVDQNDLEERSEAAAFIGTLQAGYTNFHYLRDIWQETSEKDALLGIGGTGWAGSHYKLWDLQKAARLSISVNQELSKEMNIKPAARVTCVKPSGTTSLVLGTSSGCHAWYDRYYIRRMKVNKNESIFTYLKDKIPHLLEDDQYAPDQDAFICIPMKAPDGAVIEKEESAREFLDRVAHLSKNWIKPGHVKGDNSHNVSATVKVGPDEWDYVRDWMWENRDKFNGLAVLPKDTGTYIQAPHESISEEKYNEMVRYLSDINLDEVIENNDKTARQNEIACAGGFCEIP